MCGDGFGKPCGAADDDIVTGIRHGNKVALVVSRVRDFQHLQLNGQLRRRFVRTCADIVEVSAVAPGTRKKQRDLDGSGFRIVFRAGSGRIGRLLTAAGSQCKHHYHAEYQCNNFFHVFPPGCIFICKPVLRLIALLVRCSPFSFF